MSEKVYEDETALAINSSSAEVDETAKAINSSSAEVDETALAINSSSEKTDETVFAKANILTPVVSGKKLDLVALYKSFNNQISMVILKNIIVLSDFLEDRDITVIRSSGAKQNGWKITPKCSQYFMRIPHLDNSWSFQVENEKERLTKVIKVVDLKMSLDEKDHHIVDKLIEILDIKVSE
jgi:hypothetical protein